MGPGGRGDRGALGRCPRGLRARSTHRLSRRRRWHMTCAEGRRWPSAKFRAGYMMEAIPETGYCVPPCGQSPGGTRSSGGVVTVRLRYGGGVDETRTATVPRAWSGRLRRSGGRVDQGAGRAGAIGGLKSPAEPGGGGLRGAGVVPGRPWNGRRCPWRVRLMPCRRLTETAK
ncbi:hypothetical protein STTU_5366 [Streptomyces sp. Tu6071]|nr:hypothetical protein STTU_5366 [Streptomyces sp. Tu6071]